MVRKYYQDIANLKEKYNGKQRKYRNAYNKLLYVSTGASAVGVVSGVSSGRLGPGSSLSKKLLKKALNSNFWRVGRFVKQFGVTKD